MSEPTTALTFEDLVTAVAELLEIADWDTTDGTILVPVTDKYSLDLCKRCVTNGIRMFIADAPAKGWRWMKRIMSVTQAVTYTGTATAGTTTTLTDSSIADSYADDFFNGYVLYLTGGTGIGTSLTVTDYDGSDGKFTFATTTAPDTTTTYSIAKSANAIEGDGSRYMLAEGFGGTVEGKITYADASAHGTRIDWCDESMIRDYRSESISSGYSSLAAIRPYSPTASALVSNRRWEIIFDPRPSSIQTVKFPYTLHFDKLRMVGGTSTSASTTTIADTSRPEPDDFFNGWTVKVIHGTGKFSYAVVTDYTKATGVFTVADWLGENGEAGGIDPTAGARYIVQPAGNIHPAGFMFDNVVMAACLARAQMETQDAGDNWIQEYRQVALPQAMRLDGRSAPRKLGLMTNGPLICRERDFDDVTTQNDL